MSSSDTLGSGDWLTPADAIAYFGDDATDHALEVLLAARAQIDPELPADLLRQCYAIQKLFQFDRDEQLPIVRTRRLIEGYVERESVSQSSGRSGDSE